MINHGQTHLRLSLKDKDITKRESIKKMTQDDANINAWMDDISTGQTVLPGGKGKVTAIQPPHEVETKFGNRKAIYVIIEGSDGSVINVKVFLPQNYPKIHPKSNLARIMDAYGCEKLQDLIGKEVVVEEVGDMLWKIKIE